MKIVATVLFFCISILGFSQENLSAQEKDRLLKLSKELEGCYQIQMIDTRYQPVFDLSLIQEINKKIKQDETVYFFYKKNIRIKVLSKNAMKNKEHKPLKKVIYIKKSDL